MTGWGKVPTSAFMGKSYWFECEKCGYRAKVAGKADEGLHLTVQTILCRDCKELYDSVTKFRSISGARPALQGLRSSATVKAEAARAPSFQWALNRLRYGGTKLSEWKEFPLQCPISPLHKVRAWNDPDRCPRCGVHLERSAMAFRVWD